MSSPSLLSHITSHVSVQLPNSSKASITHIGIAHLTSNIILKKVLCVTSFIVNLIFVAKIIQDANCVVVFLCLFLYNYTGSVLEEDGWSRQIT